MKLFKSQPPEQTIQICFQPEVRSAKLLKNKKYFYYSQ